MKLIKLQSVKKVMELSKRVRGFTLIEVVLVIAAGLGIVVGGLAFYQQAHDRAELTSRITVASQIRHIFRSLREKIWAWQDISVTGRPRCRG